MSHIILQIMQFHPSLYYYLSHLTLHFMYSVLPIADIVWCILLW